ncbi:MAG: YjbE family putative metal transport protein [Burkholderiales bacterium]|nr:YjbE family putative metal transport protein [Burkholderiales bacterium]
MSAGSLEFLIALLQIIGVNIVLSGDNAVVIALAARGLPPQQQKRAVAWGSGAAVVMRIALTIVAVELLRLPALKLVGSALLFWIAVKLLLPEQGGQGHHEAKAGLAAAVKTILLADLVMSLDNVIAVAAAAKGSTLLLVLGLAISIPLVVFASQLLLRLMERLPVIITIGAALLGWVAGEMAIGDPLVKPWVDAQAGWLHWSAPLAGAVAVVALGRVLASRAAARVAAGAAVPVAPAGAGAPLRRLLVATDGSPGAAAALQRALALRAQLRDGASIELQLVNVQRPLSGDVSSFVAAASIEDYHHERAERALAPARAALQGAGISAREHRRVGQPGQSIAEVAAAEGCDLIVMGARGLGSHTAALLGSVAAATLEHAGVPVLVVRAA